MSMADVTSSRSSPTPEACPECDTSASVTSDLHKYQVACTCKPSSVQYACADDPGPPPPAKTDTPPALPPRPPTSVLATNRRNNASVGCNNETPCRRRKYAWWCVGCGALAAALGGLLAAQHILLRAYTASPQHLETVPAAVPAAMLVLTGVCIMSLARRRNRYSYMIKVVGACCLVCALTCVLVTITTTVIHMNKLQTLKFCEYTKLTRTCTCFSMPPDSQHSGSEDEGVRCVFEGVTDCGVVHGALYWCLRGVFALSVSAVLVCIFSCMLAYQLLSHERKKMYWEQLELRCRSLYRPPAGQNVPANRPVQSNCSCCTQCHPTQPAWDISLQHRFWAPGRIGNLYSPNPGTGRKTSAWSWFPWPRNSQNSRHRMGAPQSGDSAYGFCEPETNVQYDQTYPGMVRQGQAFQGQCGQASGQSFQLAQAQSYPAGASFDAQTGVWGPPPPYSPQGRSGSRHHLQQDPATATLLHHHHIDVHRNSMQIHDHPNLAMQPHHPCRNSYIIHGPQSIAELNRLNPELSRINPELSRLNPELARMNPELHINPDLGRMNTELTRLNTDIARINPELIRINPELARLNPDLVRINPDLARMNPELSRINPEMRLTDVGQMPQYPSEFNELTRLQAEMSHLGQEGRFNTLRGHLVPHRNCQRSLGLSAGNLHGDCRNEDIAIECLHQKSASKVSDQSSDSGQNQKQGKENLGFQNDKHSPLRASMQECNRGVNQNAESEVYFADVSSCCNVSVKTDCCLNPNVSALVGTIENHPESTSESDTGSFTLTRQQRPQPQVGSKRRPQKHNKSLEKRQDPNSSLRLTEQQIEQLNNSIRMNDSRDRLNETRLERMNEARMSERMSDSRDRLDNRCVNECRDQRMCDRMNDSRLSDNRFNDSRISDRMNETRMSERINESRIERLNDSRISDRMIDRMNESRTSERLNDSKLERSHDSRISERMTDILNDSRMSDRMNESRFEDRRLSDMNSSLKLEGSPKIRAHISPLRIPRTSPKNFNEHLRQGSSDSGKPEFFVPPPPALSPLTPNTEESLLSDDDNGQVYSNDPESSKCLAPDSQYEVVNEEKPEALKGNHHHCYSDTNTMDSGWQSGSEKQVTD